MIGSIEPDAQTISSYAADYVVRLPQELSEGNVFAFSILLIAVYFAVIIINKLTGFILFLIKKLFLLSIVILSFYKFLAELILRTSSDGMTPDIIIFGVSGFIVGFIAFVIALYAAFVSLKTIKTKTSEECEKKGDDIEDQEKPQDQSISSIFSIDKLKDDKNIGAVLTYLVIAQFGVFSSKTISAPTEIVGMGFFAIFLVAALLFIHQSYHDYKRGIQHFLVALVFGGALSVLLGHFWGNIDIDQLLSMGYFATDSLVALTTSLSVSLFMGSKG